MWLRFVAGRPGSSSTTRAIEWCCEKLAAQRKHSWLLVWDNARLSSQQNRADLDQRTPSCLVKQTGKGVRILPFQLPTKSRLYQSYRTESWVHGKRAVVEPARLLSASELARAHLCFLWVLF
jgi:hypothetical protein